MKHFFFLFFSIAWLNAQEPLELELVNTMPFDAEQLISIDNFNTLFYIKNNTLYKQGSKKPYNYSNLQLGAITTVNTFNPLKISIYFQDLNTVVILDNRLAEIFKIDFNTVTSYRNISHISSGNDNTLWLYNQDTSQLEVFNYLTNTTQTQTLPINESVLDLQSDYNYCWLLTDKHLYIYTYFGSLLSKIPNNGYTKLSANNENCLLKKDNRLFLLKKNTTEIIPLKTPELLIKQFLLTNETVYIYDREKLHQYKIKTN